MRHSQSSSGPSGIYVNESSAASAMMMPTRSSRSVIQQSFFSSDVGGPVRSFLVNANRSPCLSFNLQVSMTPSQVVTRYSSSSSSSRVEALGLTTLEALSSYDDYDLPQQRISRAHLGRPASLDRIAMVSDALSLVSYLGQRSCDAMDARHISCSVSIGA
ncbi:hypothetical protein BJY04DRAFT_180961 [Aspergillus karnatakaensis]|uniref:uncharacterized protein n=1 Tax=Aspergillus karnatakaensis TaxID=1810916 RepID=UPI003CCCF59D